MSLFTEPRLQVNQKGSWRNVVDFKPANLDDIKAGAITLQKACPGITFRIVDGEDQKPKLCLGADGRWKAWWNE